MSKKITKKIIIIIILILLLFILFFVHNSYKRNVKPDSITLVKRIMKNKYDKIVYKNNDYIYGYYKKDNQYKYEVFDLNGNKCYSFYRDNLINIKSVNMYYFIETSDEDYLYNDDDELVLKNNEINSINDYLIKVDNNIIDYENNILFADVNKIVSYDNDYYFNINDNYLIDQKGKVILTGYKVIEEIENNFIIKCFILSKDNKYYTFVPSLEKVIGNSFDYYYRVKDRVYVVDDSNIYRLYSTGLRKKLDIDNKKLVKNYEIEKIINNNYSFVTLKDNSSFGLYDRIDDSFSYILESYNSIKKINSEHYLIKNNTDNIIYNIKTKKIVYQSKNNIDNMIMYKNGYKVLFENGIYNLYNNKDILLKKSNKQILLIDSRILFGKVLEDVSILNDNKLVDAKTFKIDSNIYAIYKENNKNIIVGIDNKNKFSSNKYINYYKDTVMYVKGNKLIFNDIKNKSIKEYNIDNYEIVSLPFKKIIIIKNNDILKIINFNGKEIKTINDVEIKNIYYNEKIGKVIMITSNSDNEELKESSYILK